MIQLRNIYKIFNESKPNEKIALEDISLDIPDGHFVAIQGKSGAGKSTLLNIIGCLDSVTKGSFLLNGQEVSNCSATELAQLRKEEFGIISQNPFLINEATSLENVLIPLYLKKMPNKERLRIASEALISVGLYEQQNQRVSTLSGGEQQRVTIARALVNNPRIILADEPTGALDNENSNIIMKILKKINLDGKTIILVTHNDELAAQVFSSIRLGDGKLVK